MRDVKTRAAMEQPKTRQKNAIPRTAVRILQRHYAQQKQERQTQHQRCDCRGIGVVRGVSAAVVLCATAVCSVDCHISRCRTCAAIVSCRCSTFWVRYLCRTYFR